MCACRMPGYGCKDDIANDGEQGAQNGCTRRSAAGKTVCSNATVERLSCEGHRSPGSKYASSGKLVVGKWAWPMYGRVQHAAAVGHGIGGRGILSAGPGMLLYLYCVM